MEISQTDRQRILDRWNGNGESAAQNERTRSRKIERGHYHGDGWPLYARLCGHKVSPESNSVGSHFCFTSRVPKKKDIKVTGNSTHIYWKILLDHILVLPGVYKSAVVVFTGNSSHMNFLYWKIRNLWRKLKKLLMQWKLGIQLLNTVGGNISNLAIKNLPLTINDQLFLDVK